MAREGQGGLRGAPTGRGVGVLRHERQAPIRRQGFVRPFELERQRRLSYHVMGRTIGGLSKEGFDRFDRQMIPKMRRLE